MDFYEAWRILLFRRAISTITREDRVHVSMPRLLGLE